MSLIKKFKDFFQKSPVLSDIIVGYDPGTGDEIRFSLAALKSLLGGANGKSAQIQYSQNGVDAWHYPDTENDKYIRFRVGDEQWSQAFKIVADDSEGGGSSQPGNDGREVELRNNGVAIQWRYEGVELWTDIVQLSDLKGDKGDKGDQGVSNVGNVFLYNAYYTNDIPVVPAYVDKAVIGLFGVTDVLILPIDIDWYNPRDVRVIIKSDQETSCYLYINIPGANNEYIEFNTMLFPLSIHIFDVITMNDADDNERVVYLKKINLIE